MNKILFYRAKEIPYGVFSNFDTKHPITINNKIWPTTEHYFQAQKFVGTPYEESVRISESPRLAANMGRNRDMPLRPDWEGVKVNIMMEAVHAKFTQYPELKELLLNTGDSEIIEHTINDSYWGDGGDGSGNNMLGKTLMLLRDILKRNYESDYIQDEWLKNIPLNSNYLSVNISSWHMRIFPSYHQEKSEILTLLENEKRPNGLFQC